jgi:hypothetical protein
MAAAIELAGMTTDEKLRLLPAVWQDLSLNPESVPAPAWHGEILEERDRRLQDGRSRLSDWSEAKKRIREQIG